MFKHLPEKLSYPNLEEEILKLWEENNVFEKSLEQRENAPYFTFYEGPPTVNGKPGIHHMMARTIKDTICRYKSLRGYYVRRQAGWDTHGLPVEIQVEKELGIKDKSHIIDYGIEKFNAACKEFVYRNIEMDEGWRTLTRRMGYWVDMDTAYITCTNDYVESVWWALKEFFDKGLIYRGFKVVPQSPTIETPLSSHEVSQGYKDVRDPNCYLKLKVTNSKKTSLLGAEILVWTTTPWTLFSNVALACGEEIEYVLVENKRKTKEEELTNRLILAKARLSVLDGTYEIIEEFLGKELVGTEYEQMFDYCFIDKKEFPNALTVLAGDFVSTSDGSGVVHLAPAFGEDDYRMSRLFNLPFLQPVSPNGHLTDELGPFAGRAIKNFTYEDHTEEGVDKDVIIALKHADKIYRNTNDYVHSYPHCWRTGNPLMYYARESWFIKSPEYKEQMISINKDINWQPKEIGTGRFGNWLDEVKEWSLSRDRFWGTPLPLWVAEDDKNDIFAVGSIDELCTGLYVNADGSKVPLKDCGKEIDLHRPFVDNVIFEKNGKTYRRVHEVIDAWFDSGAMPFAQFHYPFENKELFDKSFPADFIAEGIDQTRGWFYTLHNIATALFNKPAYKNIVVNELILDKNGVKMSKRLGNSVDPFDIMNRLGADAVRWYLFINNPPWKTTKFDESDILKTVISDFFRSLTNTYSFFSLYSNIDKFDGSDALVPIENRPEIDRWIISRCNSLIKDYSNLMDEYELTKAQREIQNFVIDDLSNWYIRRNRRRFWKGEKDTDKIAAYQTLHSVLLSLCSLIAPTSPFISDYLYQRLKLEGAPVSIHLLDFPLADESAIDLALETKMALAEKIVILARSLREKSKIRTRQPLQRILVPVMNPQERRDIQSLEDVIMEELNIKAIEFVSEDTSDIVRRTAKGNFKVIGKKFGKITNKVADYIKTFNNEMIIKLEKGNLIEATIENEIVSISLDDIEITSEDIEGWLVATDGGVTVALDTHITADLMMEGTAREFVNRVQNLRKDSGFEVTDRIKIAFKANDEITTAINAKAEYVKNETLASEIDALSDDTNATKLEIFETEVLLNIEKII